jgi:AcrR family transcriptional regulator
MVIRHRATNDEQKEERRQTILSAAFELFESISYDAVSMDTVAKRAGIAKGTVYLYFRTKEELFLELLTQEFENWFSEIEANLTLIREVQGGCTIDELAARIAATLQNRPTFIRLVAILHAILERNIDYFSALHFEQMLTGHMTRTGNLIELCLPFFKPGYGVNVIRQAYVLITGVHHLAEPAPIVRLVVEEEDLAMFQVDFTNYFSNSLRYFMLGLRQAAP